MKTRTINGITFEVMKPVDFSVYDRVYNHSRSDIFDYYKRPSETKIAIWEDWIEWMCDTDTVTNYYVSSANCMQFTITASCLDRPNKERYILYITKGHNRLYPVK